MKKIIFYIIKNCNKILYPKYDVENSLYSQIVILRYGFFQKILGFNRSVPWPVHYTSTVSPYKKIKPGTRTPGMSKGCHLDARNGIEIGKNVWIGPHAKIISMNHDVNNYHNYISSKPIKIADNCWLGANVIILANVELGEHTVVAAGAIVTKSFKKGNQVIAGNPAKVIKQLSKYGVEND